MSHAETAVDVETTSDHAPMSRPWLEGRVATEARDLARIDREIEARRKLMTLRARIGWELERKVEVEILAANLARKPGVIVAKLKCSKQGCDWLLERWQMLERVSAGRTYLLPAERTLAQNLLATPEEFRQCGTLDPRFPGMPAAELIRSQITELEALKAEGLDELDAMNRAGAIEGRDVLGDKPLAAMKRESAACQRRMQWAIRKLEADDRAERRLVPEKAVEAPIPEVAALPPPPPQRQSGSRKARRAERRQRVEALTQRHLTRPTTPDEIDSAVNSRLLAVSASVRS